MYVCVLGWIVCRVSWLFYAYGIQRCIQAVCGTERAYGPTGIAYELEYLRRYFLAQASGTSDCTVLLPSTDL